VAYINNLKIWKFGNLLHAQQAFYEILVSAADFSLFRHQSLSFRGFLGKNVSLESFLECNFPGAGDFKSFFGTRICFNLWHLMMRFRMIPYWRICTGSSLMGPFGQFPPGRDHLKMEREGKCLNGK
jgi:hypothetical protein